jgi:hypothetical protein
MKKPIRVTYNWFVKSDGQNSIEHYYEYNVGEDGVEKILERYPKFQGDPWVCDIIFTDGSVERISNVNKIFYEAQP